MTYKTVSNNEGTHVVLDGAEIAIKPDRASALDFIAGHATQRAEAAEARVAQAESEHQNDVKNLRHYMALADSLEAQRDEARRQLSEAQHAIDVLSRTVVAQNNEIKRLRQQREDVEQYRARVNELLEACKAAHDWFKRNTKQGHTPGPVEKMLIDAMR